MTQNLTCILRVLRKNNSTVRFFNYVIMFILLNKVVALGYNQFYS